MATPDRRTSGREPPEGEGPESEEPKRWWERGEEPDYRATLANERTFLAWTRTALAFLAGSLAVLSLRQVAPFPLRLALSAYLIALAVLTTITGYVQWRRRQQRMRLRSPLGHTAWQAVLALAFCCSPGSSAASRQRARAEAVGMRADRCPDMSDC
jgi:putative membrane protein